MLITSILSTKPLLRKECSLVVSDVPESIYSLRPAPTNPKNCRAGGVPPTVDFERSVQDKLLVSNLYRSFINPDKKTPSAYFGSNRMSDTTTLETCVGSPAKHVKRTTKRREPSSFSSGGAGPHNNCGEIRPAPQRDVVLKQVPEQ
jgi:hypothetical protein